MKANTTNLMMVTKSFRSIHDSYHQMRVLFLLSEEQMVKLKQPFLGLLISAWGGAVDYLYLKTTHKISTKLNYKIK